MEECKVIVFKVGEELYGLDIKDVQGIENVTGYTQVPNTASYVKGIINLRGDIIPVYSLRKKFGMEDLEKEILDIVVVLVGNMRLAVEIDEISVIQNVDESMMHNVPSIVRTPNEQYYDKVLSVDGKIIVVLNVEKMLSAEEKEAMSKLVGEN